MDIDNIRNNTPLSKLGYLHKTAQAVMEGLLSNPEFDGAPLPADELSYELASRYLQAGERYESSGTCPRGKIALVHSTALFHLRALCTSFSFQDHSSTLDQLETELVIESYLSADRFVKLGETINRHCLPR
jgi:hypothetical protein